MEWRGQATPKGVWEPWEVGEGAGYQVGSHCRGCGSMRCVVLSLWRPLRPVETTWGGLQLGVLSLVTPPSIPAFWAHWGGRGIHWAYRSILFY